jgi:hypothetical protein
VGHDVWITIGGVIVSFVLTLYGKRLTEWREAKEKSWSAIKTAREDRYQKQVILYLEDPHSYTNSLIEYAIGLIMSFGCMIFGLLALLFEHVVLQPLTSPVSYVERIALLLSLISGSALIGFGFAIMLGELKESHRKLKASRSLVACLAQRSSERGPEASAPNASADDPSDTSL